MVLQLALMLQVEPVAYVKGSSYQHKMNGGGGTLSERGLKVNLAP